MSTKHENPYRVGSDYHEMFGLWMKKQIITKSELVAMGRKLGKTIAGAFASANVILSSNKNNAGNAACHGEASYGQALKKRQVGEEKRFRLFWRKAGEMERTQRKDNAKAIAKAAKKVKAVKQVKTVKANKVPAKVEAPAVKVEAPATA